MLIDITIKNEANILVGDYFLLHLFLRQIYVLDIDLFRGNMFVLMHEQVELIRSRCTKVQE